MVRQRVEAGGSSPRYLKYCAGPSAGFLGSRVHSPSKFWEGMYVQHAKGGTIGTRVADHQRMVCRLP